MFKNKYTVTLLNSKWIPLKRNINLSIIPRRDEFIYFDGKYYQVLNIIHKLNEKQDIFIIVDEYVKEKINKVIDN